MANYIKTYKPVVIPLDGNPPYLPPLVIARDDLTSTDAYIKLADQHDPYLEVDDFLSIDLFEKYWFASLGFLEYPYMFITGDVGTGKSLLLNYTAHKLALHFGKKIGINWVAETAALFSPFCKWSEYKVTAEGKANISNLTTLETYIFNDIASAGQFYLNRVPIISRETGLKDESRVMNSIKGLLDNSYILEKSNTKVEPYFTMTDSAYVERMQDEVNEFVHELMVEKRKPKTEELEKLLIFNLHFSIDEGSGVAGKGLGTNLIKLLGMVGDRRRHFYLSEMISFVKPDDATGSLNADNSTHIIQCSKDKYYAGACSFKINHRRGGVIKMLHLKPAEWSHIWDSHNPVAINATSNVHFGNVKAKEVEKKRRVKEGIE